MAPGPFTDCSALLLPTQGSLPAPLQSEQRGVSAITLAGAGVWGASAHALNAELGMEAAQSHVRARLHVCAPCHTCIPWYNVYLLVYPGLSWPAWLPMFR